VSGLVVEDAYSLLCDVSLAASAHFCVCLVSHRVYKRIDCLFGSERGGAARLARGAHNPKVGSSNLPPATNELSPTSENLVKTLWSLRNLSKNTQKTYAKMLRHLNEHTDLNDPESIERYVFNKDWKNKSRANYFNAYQHYCKEAGIDWNRPKLKEETYPVKVPTEEKINLIISQATPRYATIYHLSKHGLRPDEISKITLRDIDLETGSLVVRTSKLGLERTLKLKPEAKDLLREYIYRNRITTINKRIFPKVKTIRNCWRKYRQKAYEKLRDTELLKIRLYDLRHWYGTTQYIKTRDIFHVKYLMGHRNIESTLHYMHIAKGLVSYSDEYHVKIAKTIEEFTQLLEQGFEYISDYDECKVLRKRK